MLSAAATVDLTFDDDDWVPPKANAKLYRAASVGNSWGVTSFGRGFDWKRRDDGDEDEDNLKSHKDIRQAQLTTDPSSTTSHISTIPSPSHVKNHAVWGSTSSASRNSSATSSSVVFPMTPMTAPAVQSHGSFISGPFSRSPVQSRCSSPSALSPANLPPSLIALNRPSMSRSPSSPRLDHAEAPRSRRRSSHQRVSLIAGRLSIVPSRPPSPPPTAPQKLVRASSAASFLSVASSTGPPTPGIDKTPGATERSISEFVVEDEIGRGAYGLVKRAREMNIDGTLGVRGVYISLLNIRLTL